MLYEAGNGSQHTPFGVSEMLDTPPSHIILKKKFFATAENFFCTHKKNSLSTERLQFLNPKFFSQILPLFSIRAIVIHLKYDI